MCTESDQQVESREASKKTVWLTVRKTRSQSCSRNSHLVTVWTHFVHLLGLCRFCIYMTVLDSSKSCERGDCMIFKKVSWKSCLITEGFLEIALPWQGTVGVAMEKGVDLLAPFVQCQSDKETTLLLPYPLSQNPGTDSNMHALVYFIIQQDMPPRQPKWLILHCSIKLPHASCQGHTVKRKNKSGLLNLER